MSIVKRAIGAVALAFVVCGSLAVAADRYIPAASSSCAPCGEPVCAAPTCMPATCDSCSAAVGSTSLPGYYSDDYDYTVSARTNQGIIYMRPTRAGWIESRTMPLTNPVDKYYATHVIQNGQVVDIGMGDADRNPAIVPYR